MVLVKVPTPVPSVVFVDNETVGLGEVSQTTPLAVIVPPPSFVTLPPLVAVVELVELTVAVVTTGKIGLVAPPIIFVHIDPL
jgi:hypothetical protein